MIKSSELIKWCKSKVGCGYVYGTAGEICTAALLKSLNSLWGPGGKYDAKLGDGYYSLKGDYTKGRCAKWIGKWVTDCSGLIKAGRKALGGGYADVSAQGTYNQCTKRGVIKDMPLIPGCTVYMYSATKKRMGHVGIYIGNNLVVEARGADYGVVTTKLSDRAWTHWGLLDWLEYDLADENKKAVVGTQTDAGDSTNAKPDDTVTVKEFQDAFGLDTDGVVGPVTLAKMKEVKELINKYVKG